MKFRLFTSHFSLWMSRKPLQNSPIVQGSSSYVIELESEKRQTNDKNGDFMKETHYKRVQWPSANIADVPVYCKTVSFS